MQWHRSGQRAANRIKWVPALITLPRAFGALSAMLFQGSEKESGRSKYIRRQILYLLFCCMFRHNMLAPCCYHEPGCANCSFLDSESRDCGSNAPQGCRLQSHGCIYCQDWNCVQWTGQCLGGCFGTFSMAPHCGTRHTRPQVCLQACLQKMRGPRNFKFS